MVEQLTLNQRVVGSSPTRFTKSSINMRPLEGRSVPLHCDVFLCPHRVSVGLRMLTLAVAPPAK
jgi:hypothetical protein